MSRFLHTMVRVKDLDASVKFYTEVLGMKELRRSDNETGKYTLAVMSAIRVFGVFTALALGTYMFAMVRRDRRMDRATGSPFSELPSGPAIP